MTIFPQQFDPDLLLEQVTVTDEITLTLRATSPTAVCPDCGTISTRIQSRYCRTVHDLPHGGRPVHLVLQVRRFRCQKSSCARKMFAERFPDLTRPHAQRTIRLQEALRHLGLAVGGQAGTLLGSELGISGSRDTILRLVRMYELPPAAPPKKVGVDDWARKRGHRYGTLLCDLERGVPIDLLPDRSVETVSAWFVAHPGIELISRDGSSEYAAAALKGAPQAVQVADKWHILKNLRKALGVLLTPHLTAHRKKKTPKSGTQKELTFPQDQARRLSPRQTRIQHLHRQERLARYEQVVALAKQGMKHRAIADQVGVGLTTIHNWLRAGSFPERKPREQSSQLDPYRPYVEKRRSEGYHNLMGIYRELRAQGYRGSYETMYAQFAHSSRSHRSQQASSSSLPHVLPSSQQAAFLFLRRSEDLTAEEQATIMRLRRLHPEVELAYTFVQQFTQMLRTRTGEQLDGWLQAVASSPLTDLQPFVGSVYEDKEAILAGLTREESNGPTEGHITRLKLIKRSMYGRAKFDLLRLRVLSHPQKAQDAKTQADHKQREEHGRKLKVDQITPVFQQTTFGSSEVA